MTATAAMAIITAIPSPEPQRPQTLQTPQTPSHYHHPQPIIAAATSAISLSKGFKNGQKQVCSQPIPQQTERRPSKKSSVTLVTLVPTMATTTTTNAGASIWHWHTHKCFALVLHEKHGYFGADMQKVNTYVNIFLFICFKYHTTKIAKLIKNGII